MDYELGYKVEYLLDECKSLYSEDDYLGVIGICDEILKHDLNNPKALGYKAESLRLLGRGEDALTLLDNARIIYPDNPYYLAIRADVLMDMNEYEKAICCFEEIFEMGVCDEVVDSFIKMDYETCLGLMVDLLIEREKYVEAWKYYNRMSESESAGLERSVKLDRFKTYVMQYSSRQKRRQYYVKISSDDAKSKLIEFLLENGFEGGDDCGVLFSIDVVDKIYAAVSVDEVGSSDIISESQFYYKVNYYPRGMIEQKKIYGEDGKLLYEGYTLHNSPYGFGKAYFANGELYREGIFDIKGIVQGKEYYPSGQLRFEGRWCLTRGYGPNAPCDGNAYDKNGELIYSGKFEIKRGGVGWPMIQKPKGFGLEQKERPKIDYY